jgi:hypothetical protein
MHPLAIKARGGTKQKEGEKHWRGNETEEKENREGET